MFRCGGGEICDRRHNISPVEVKSGRSYAYESLSKFRRKFASFLDKAYVLHVKDINEKDGVFHLPLYMAPLLVGADTDSSHRQKTEG